MNKSLMTGFGISIAAVLLLAVNIFASKALHSVNVDLTEDGLYSLSGGTRNILAELEEPITLRFFYSRQVAEEETGLAPYARRVRELLEEYDAATSELDLLVIEPEPFSEEEDEAVGYGLTGARVGVDSLYFGLVGTNSVDDERVIAFFDPTQESLLEYEISELVYDLAHDTKKVVGIMSRLPLRGVSQNPQQPAQPWAIIPQLEQIFELRWLEPETTEAIDAEIDVLMLVHPKQLPDTVRFAIDQYALGGGKILCFVDALANFDQDGGPQNPAANLTSDPDDLLSSWGVEMTDSRMAGDSEAAQDMGNNVFFPLFMGLEGDNLSEDDFATTGLKLVNLFTSGILTTRADATTQIEPLLQTGTESAPIDTIKMQFQPDVQAIADSFVPRGERLTVAVRITGDIETAFPAGAPGGDDEAATDEPENGEPGSDGEEGDTESEPEPVDDSLKKSTSTFNAIVVGDTDMLYNDLWGTPQRDIFGRTYLMPRADNAKFLINCLENLCGSTDLISLRGRGHYQRPFDKKLELQKEAGEEYRQNEEELQAKLRETESRLAELQKERDDTGGQLLTEEQRDAIERFRAEQVQTRRDLRDVQHQLQKDIDGLGTWLKFHNIALLPLVILVGGLAFFISKRV